MSTEARWTIADLAGFPDDDGKRYEIIDGELYVSKQPHWRHQYAAGKLTTAFDNWNDGGGGGLVLAAPGIVFNDDEGVAPDVVWYSAERLALADTGDGHFHSAPELAIEILSPGRANEERDRKAKLALYSRRGVLEYWIVDWRAELVEIYRRAEAALQLVATLYRDDTITTPLLPGFALAVQKLFPPQR
jgi:Uma2 family endonuclease